MPTGLHLVCVLRVCILAYHRRHRNALPLYAQVTGAVDAYVLYVEHLLLIDICTHY